MAIFNLMVFGTLILLTPLVALRLFRQVAQAASATVGRAVSDAALSLADRRSLWLTRARSVRVSLASCIFMPFLMALVPSCCRDMDESFRCKTITVPRPRIGNTPSTRGSSCATSIAWETDRLKDLPKTFKIGILSPASTTSRPEVPTSVARVPKLKLRTSRVHYRDIKPTLFHSVHICGLVGKNPSNILTQRMRARNASGYTKQHETLKLAALLLLESSANTDTDLGLLHNHSAPGRKSQRKSARLRSEALRIIRKTLAMNKVPGAAYCLAEFVSRAEPQERIGLLKTYIATISQPRLRCLAQGRILELLLETNSLVQVGRQLTLIRCAPMLLSVLRNYLLGWISYRSRNYTSAESHWIAALKAASSLRWRVAERHITGQYLAHVARNSPTMEIAVFKARRVFKLLRGLSEARARVLFSKFLYDCGHLSTAIKILDDGSTSAGLTADEQWDIVRLRAECRLDQAREDLAYSILWKYLKNLGARKSKFPTAKGREALYYFVRLIALNLYNESRHWNSVRLARLAYHYFTLFQVIPETCSPKRERSSVASLQISLLSRIADYFLSRSTSGRQSQETLWLPACSKSSEYKCRSRVFIQLLRRRENEIRGCIANHSITIPRRTLTVRLTLLYDTKGSVRSIKVTSKKTIPPKAAKCLEERASKWQMPECDHFCSWVQVEFPIEIVHDR